MDRDVNVERLRSEVDELQKSRNDIDRLIERKNLLILKAIPGVYGFESMDALIGTLAQFASNDLRERIGASPPSLRRGGGKGRRYPAELRVTVRKALEAGESASQIARAQGVSLGTLIRWKKLWGVGSRRGEPRTTRVRPSAEGAGADATGASVPTNGASEPWAL